MSSGVAYERVCDLHVILNACGNHTSPQQEYNRKSLYFIVTPEWFLMDFTHTQHIGVCVAHWRCKSRTVLDHLCAFKSMNRIYESPVYGSHVNNMVFFSLSNSHAYLLLFIKRESLFLQLTMVSFGSCYVLCCLWMFCLNLKMKKQTNKQTKNINNNKKHKTQKANSPQTNP